MSTSLVSAYRPLFRELSARLYARNDGSLRRPMAEELGLVLDDYVTAAWAQMPAVRRQQLAELSEHDRTVAALSFDKTSGVLRRVVPAGPTDTTRHTQFAKRLELATAHVGERIVGLHIAGEATDRIEAVAAMLEETLHGANLAGIVQQVALLQRRTPSELAPAVFAAVLAHSQPNLGLSAAQAMDKYRLADGSTLPTTTLHALADTFQQCLRDGALQINNSLTLYETVARDAFAPAAEEAAERPIPERYRPYLQEPKRQPVPRINLGGLKGFMASSRGRTEEAAIDGTLEVFQNIISVAATRSGGAPRQDLLGRGVEALDRLAVIMREEKRAHSDVEQKWKQVDTERKFAAQRAQDPTIAVPLPDDFNALTRRAMYYKDAIIQGAPLGQALAEIYDGNGLTFGPTERQFMERVAFYAARKYAANFAARDDARVAQVSERSVRVQEVRTILAEIEVALRRQEQLDDADLIADGVARVRQAAADGDLTEGEARVLLGDNPKVADNIVEAMVTRIRAGQEVRYLTSVMALEGQIPKDVVQNYTRLPHTRRIGSSTTRVDGRLNQMLARNGEPMTEFEEATRIRWMQYRDQAVAGRDVKPIRLDTEEEAELDNPLDVKGFRPKQRHQQRRPTPDHGDDFDGEPPRGGGGGGRGRF